MDNKKNKGIPFRSIKRLDKRRKYIEQDLGVKKVYIYIYLNELEEMYNDIINNKSSELLEILFSLKSKILYINIKIEDIFLLKDSHFYVIDLIHDKGFKVYIIFSEFVWSVRREKYYKRIKKAHNMYMQIGEELKDKYTKLRKEDSNKHLTDDELKFKIICKYFLENMIYNRTKVLLEEYIDKTGEEKKNIKLKYINMLTKTLYLGIINKRTVCSGFAIIFYIFSRILKLDSIMIESASHIWNQICINGIWYNFDSTTIITHYHNLNKMDYPFTDFKAHLFNVEYLDIYKYDIDAEKETSNLTKTEYYLKNKEIIDKQIKEISEKYNLPEKKVFTSVRMKCDYNKEIVVTIENYTDKGIDIDKNFEINDEVIEYFKTIFSEKDLDSKKMKKISKKQLKFNTLDETDILKSKK
ncbi:MAG: hypothetical protein ACTTGJ_00725 [Clostridium sp.]